VPQALTLDDLDKLATPAQAAPAPAAAAPAGVRALTLDDLDKLAAPAAAAPKPSKWESWTSDDPAKQNIFKAFYAEGVEPIVGMIHDSIARGDLGEKAASDILSAFKDQLGTFAAHPDIRNLPLVGPGATATANKLQRQFDAGNYQGMIGTAAGFVGALLAPEAHAAIVEKLPAVAQAAVRASDAAGRFGEAAVAGTKAAAGAAAPDVLAGAGKAAAAALAEHFVPGGGELTKVAEYAGLAKGGQQVAQGVGKGYQAGRAAYEDVRAAQAARDAAAARAASPRVPIWQQAYDAADAERAAAAARPPTAPLWEDARRGAADTADVAPDASETALLDEAKARIAALDAARAGRTAPIAADFEAAPDARETLTPEMQARADVERAASHAEGGAPPVADQPDAELTVQPVAAAGSNDIYDQSVALVRAVGKASASTLQRKLGLRYDAAQKILGRMEAEGIIGPADGAKPREVLQAAAPVAAPESAAPAAAERPLTPQETLEDAIHQHAAYLQMQAENLEHGNRARMADRFAEYLIKNDLEATPGNIERATREMDERKLPSEDTAQMIQDRIDWFNAKQKAAAAPPALPIWQQDAATVGAAPAAEVGAAATSAPAAAAPSLEQQLEASIRAVKSRRGQQPEAAPVGHFESEIPVSGPSAGNEMVTGGAGGRPALAASDSARAGTSGESTAVDIPGEQRAYPATYTVKELDDIQPSHQGATFQPNPKYGHANDRQYDDPRNQRKIVDWSTRQGFNPRNLLNTAPTSEIGPPIVDAAGNVLGGNGRSMIMQRVYQGNPEGAAAYRAELDRTAAHYGIDPASYAHMKQPVLVRELDPEVLKDEGTAARAITDFNKTGTAALTPAERAIADARGVSQRTLDDIAARMDRLGPDATLAQTVEGRQGIEILRNIERDGVISPQEAAGLATETKLTRQGKERISGLMLGRFFTDAKQMDSLPDALRNKLERMAAPLARAETVADYSLRPTIKSALDLLEDADAHGAATLDDYLKQQGLFGEREYSPEAIAFAKALKSTNPVELTHAARRYAERVKYREEYQGPGMFGDIPPPLPPREAFGDSFGHLAK
jgi:hypothetical protein